MCIRDRSCAGGARQRGGQTGPDTTQRPGHRGILSAIFLGRNEIMFHGLTVWNVSIRDFWATTSKH